jgi:hypothetical protein
VRTHAVDCGHAEYLLWKLDSGFLENSAQATLRTDDKWHHEYCWFCGNGTESGTLVRWFPLDHVAFHEECVRKLGWERRYLTKAQWIDCKRKFRISWEQQLKETSSAITSGSVARDYSLPLPKQFLLITGISGSGKSSYAKHLHDAHEFHFANTDEDEGLIKEAVFLNHGLVVRYLGEYRLVAWEWGFRPELLKYVLALKRQGAKLLWFKADLVVARSMYAKAHPEDPNCVLWDAQIQGIEEARLPTDAFQIVETFRNGMFRPHEELDDEILHST